MIISFCFTEVNFFFYLPFKENLIMSIAGATSINISFRFVEVNNFLKVFFYQIIRNDYDLSLERRLLIYHPISQKSTTFLKYNKNTIK